MHCHSHYSADHVEHGASPEVLQQAAKATGLDFVSCTDHAYDFAYTTEDYTKEAESPLTRFDALHEEVRKLNQATGMPLMIAGEEVSAGNSKGENVHMTVLGPNGYLPGLGDCGRNWLDNKPTFRIPKLLEMTTAHCFAAHPMQPMGYLEKFIFRRGYWSHKDLNLDAAHKIRGIQFWNGIRDEGFKLGRQWWIEELGKGNFLLPIGGNDAHGDLNDTTSVSTPLFSLKHSRNHVFGKVRTVVRINSPLTLDMLNDAFLGLSVIAFALVVWVVRLLILDPRQSPSMPATHRTLAEPSATFAFSDAREIATGRLAKTKPYASKVWFYRQPAPTLPSTTTTSPTCAPNAKLQPENSP